MKSVFVKEDGVTGEVGNVEMVHEVLVLKVLDRFLTCNHVPFTCDVLLNGLWLPSSGSRIPAQTAGSSLLKQTVWPPGVERVFWLGRKDLSP